MCTLSSTSRMRIQTRALTSPSRSDGTSNGTRRRAGRRGRGARRKRQPEARPTHRRRQIAGPLGRRARRAHGAVLKRSRVIVGSISLAKPSTRATEREAHDARRGEIHGDAARSDGVHHQPMAEAAFGRRALLADQRATRVDRRRTLASLQMAPTSPDGWRKALKLRHDFPQEDRARGRRPSRSAASTARAKAKL